MINICRPYCCETCNKSYYRKYLLINHQKRCIGKSSHEQISHSEQRLVQSPSIDQTRHKSSNDGLAINLANDGIPEGITVIKLPPRSIQTQIAHHKSIADIKIATQSEVDQNESVERESGVSLSFPRIQSNFNQPGLDQCRNAFSQNGSLKIGEHVPLSQNNHDSLTQFRINEKQILQQCESQATLNMQQTSPLIKNNEFCKESLGQRIYLDDLSTHILESAQFQCQIASKRSLQSNCSQLFVKPAQRTESIRSLAEQLESLQGYTPTQQFQTAYIPKMLVQAQASLHQQTNFQLPLASAGNGSLQNQSQLHQSTGTAITTNQMILYPLASSCMEDGISHNSSTNVNSLIIYKSVPQNFSEQLVLQKPYENQHRIENNQVSGVLYSRFMVPSNATELNRQEGQNQLNHFDRPQEPSFSQACHQNQNIGSPIYIINIPQPQAVPYYQNIKSQTGILANGANFQQNNKGQFMISYAPNLKSNLALLHPLIPSTLQNQIYF
ncbi:hypothetical protein FGO68_gene518 [Halteria grandinella]|uniref:C2H2-type domain-containing protein n=1 Tax=Halteria grandinella TaxID=5974 RepID=A0A8J8T600_HALGN|nr:hypothetical protein FGO68_gene518 [Halteria grandinella]